MKRYQKLLGPIVLGLCAWGVVLGYCAKSGECGQPVRDVIEAVRAAGSARLFVCGCVRDEREPYRMDPESTLMLLT